MILRRLQTTYARTVFETLKTDEKAYTKNIKFYDFCKQMAKLEKQHQSDMKEVFFRREELKRIALASRDPVRETLSMYSNKRSDFSSGLIVDIVEALSKILMNRDYPAYSDFSFDAMIDTWQFQLILSDIVLGVEEKEYIPPLHVAQIIKAFSDMGYKDTDLVGKMLNYVNKQISSPSVPQFRQLGKSHIYSGFLDNQEFKEHMNTILEWKFRTPPTEHSILQEIETFTDSIHDLKHLQTNFASAIANITDQYYSLVAAQHSHDYLRTNYPISRELLRLQEILVEAGILNPYHLEDVENFENLDKLMENAEKTFTNIVSYYFPYLHFPMIDRLYEASKEYSHPTFPESKVAPSANSVSALVFGKLAIGLSSIMRLEKEDLHENDYPNVVWKIRAKPKSHQLQQRRENIIELPYTSMWIQNKKFLEDHLPEIRKSAENADMLTSCELLYGMGNACIADQELLDILSARVLALQEQVDPEVLAYAIYGLGMANSHESTAKVLVNLLSTHPSLEELTFSGLIRSLWGQFSLNLVDSPELLKFVKILNEFDGFEITKEDSRIFRDVVLSIQHQLKHLDIELSYALSAGAVKAAGISGIFSSTAFDPLKPLLSKITRHIMQQGLTEEEVRIIHKKLQQPDLYEMHPCDDYIALNGHKVSVFFANDNGFYKKHLLGTYQIKLRHYEAGGMKGLPLPIHEIINVDYTKPDFSFKSVDVINELIAKHVGIPKNYLEKMDKFVNEFIKIMRAGEHEIADCNQGLMFFEDMIGAYKVQSLHRLKVSERMRMQSLEEIKLQLFKMYNRFPYLKTESQKLLNELAVSSAGAKSFEDLLRSVNSTIEVKQPLEKSFWTSYRQNMHIPRKDYKNPDITDELINQRFLMLKDYFQYADWASEIISSYPYHSDMSLYEDGLFNNYYFVHRRQQIGKLPDPLCEKNSHNDPIPASTAAMVFLTNLKYELKRNLSDSEIVDRILGLDILDAVTKEHLRPAKGHGIFLRRNPEKFTNFLEAQIKVTEDTDPYVKFYREIYGLEKSKTELFDNFWKAKHLINSNSELSTIEKQLEIKDLTNKYLATREVLTDKDPERGVYLDHIFRNTVDVKTDPRTLRVRKFDLRDEPDFMKFENDEDLLDFKMRKAETNLVKLRILLKLHKDQPLTPDETEYLSQYRTALSTSNVLEAGSVFIPEKSTSYTLKDLSDKDREKLLAGLHRTAMPKSIESVSLRELLFELSHFLDDYLIRRIEFSIIENKELKDWGVVPDAAGGSKLKPQWKNKAAWVQNSAMEEYYWRKLGDMDAKDEQHFLKLFGTFRNKGHIDAVYWKMDLQSYNELMEDCKGSDFKYRFLKQWYLRKLEEYKMRVTVPEGKFAKSDKGIFEHRIEEIHKRSGEEFETWLGMGIKDIDSDNIEKVLSKLLRTIEDGVDFRVMEFTRIVYFHKELKGRLKEELYAVIQNLKMPVYEGGMMFSSPVPVRGDKLAVEITDQEWQDRIENASVNFVPNIIQKIIA